jgi:hypothetical protein
MAATVKAPALSDEQLAELLALIDGGLYPDNSMILELSTKCAPSEANQVGAEARGFLAQRDIDLGSEQETKTKKALEFFSKRLQDEGV